jgi:type II secretory pathway pseudopilin PulG
MIEIALSLAIIGFALVAIIGVLPIGMNAQKDNREETIINQDASVFFDAIRNGARGLDDLTNYVFAITNEVTGYRDDRTLNGVHVRYGYTLTNSDTPAQFPLTNGFRIVGLLSTPKYLPWNAGGFLSNNVVAYVRSISGPASEKFPQQNPSMQDLAFSYRMTSEVVPYGTNYFDWNWTNYTAFATNTPEYATRYNYWRVVNNLQGNLHDLRLTFRWPLRSRGQLGPGGQAFRTLIGGSLLVTNEPSFPHLNPPTPPPYDLYFCESRNYTNSNLYAP